MSTECKSCGEYFMCKCDSAQVTEESAQHSLQQLKAEICYIGGRMRERNWFLVDHNQWLLVAEKLRKLSAV